MLKFDIINCAFYSVTPGDDRLVLAPTSGTVRLSGLLIMPVDEAVKRGILIPSQTGPDYQLYSKDIPTHQEDRGCESDVYVCRECNKQCCFKHHLALQDQDTFREVVHVLATCLSCHPAK